MQRGGATLSRRSRYREQGRREPEGQSSVASDSKLCWWSRGRKAEGWGRVSVSPSFYYFTVKVCESVLTLVTVEERNVRMNSTVWFIWRQKVVIGWKINRKLLETKENKKRFKENWPDGFLTVFVRLCVCVCVCVFWAHSQCFVFFSLRLTDITTWVFVWRRRRTEESLQRPAVCLWRVIGLNMNLHFLVMNLDPHTQSKRPFLL